MAKNNWRSAEVIEKHAADIIKWKKEEGLGRFNCAKRLHELTGRYCSAGVMQSVLQKLFPNKYAPRKQRISIVDKTGAVDEIPIEELISSRVKISRKKVNKSKNKHNKLL